MYSVLGRTAGIGSGAAVAAASLWNPHSSLTIKLLALSVALQDTTNTNRDFLCARINARGTPASTVTPNISKDSRRGVAPQSGTLLDLGVYSVEPTLDGDFQPPYMQFGGNVSMGKFVFHRFGNGLYIPPGAGFSVIDITNVGSGTNVRDYTFTWVEDF